ncbi:MAG TPA: hypothetical protein VMD98_05750 [Bryocella sp.]|nr:hypothetical protein [Bryocella sp.]
MIRSIRYSLFYLGTLAALAGLAPAVRAQQAANAGPASDDISGAYSFLREGEVVQLTVEDGKLSGYISRFGDSDSDKDQFIDQFFDKTTLEGDRLTFDTKTVHGVWYEFSGVAAIAAGKKPGQEGYRVIRGKLIQHRIDESGKDKAQQRQVEFKSFPAEVNR